MRRAIPTRNAAHRTGSGHSSKGGWQMPGDKGASFPIAAIGVVMLLVSSAFVGQRAFDLLRLAETATNRQQQLQPPVEARLWEDPLAALARHRDKYKDRCDVLAVKRAAPAAQQTVAALRAAVATNKDVPPLVNEGEDRVRYDPICDGAPPDFSSPVSDPEFTVIVALLPGASFVGAEELRRRMRCRSGRSRRRGFRAHRRRTDGILQPFALRQVHRLPSIAAVRRHPV